MLTTRERGSGHLTYTFTNKERIRVCISNVNNKREGMRTFSIYVYKCCLTH